MILVTGASGLLGSSVVMMAQKQGRDVVGLYHRHPVNLPAARLLPADLTDDSRIRQIFDELRPTGVIHCGAQTNVDWCQEHPEAARRINVAGSATIARITAQQRAPLLYISTDSVFDGSGGNYSETDQPAPLNVYAESKLEGERRVQASNPAAAIARVTIYGWNVQYKQSLAEWILDQLALGRTVPGFTDVIFCPILANDLAEILLTMLDRKLSGIYHVVGSETVTKYEFARRVAATFGFDSSKVVPTLIAEAKLKAPRPRDTSLSTQRIGNALGCSMPDVDSGLHRFALLQADGYVKRMRTGLAEVRE